MATPIVQTELEKRLAAMKTGFEAPAGSVAQPVVAPVAETNAEAVAEQQAAETSYATHIADLLAQNETIRRQRSEAFDRKEKEAKSRKTWAAISDALSSLGNLVGTGLGAPNQPQTYQMPLVNQDIEQDRALARATAERLRANDQNLLLTQAQYDAKLGAANNQLAVQKMKGEQQKEIALINGQIGLQKVGMQQQGANSRAAYSAAAADKRNQDNIASREREGAKNRKSREKIAADRIAQMDKNARAKQYGTRRLTENAKAQKILKDAEMGVLSDLKPELEKNGVTLPYEWTKNWRQYVKLAPDFYKKNFVDKGWGELGGTINDVNPNDDDENYDEFIAEDEDYSEYEV